MVGRQRLSQGKTNPPAFWFIRLVAPRALRPAWCREPSAGLAALLIASGLALSGCGDKIEAASASADSRALTTILTSPWSGSPIAVPGRIEAESFDNGGEGLAYHDTTPGNAMGQFRATDVDIGVTSDTDGGYSVGWTDPGEWLGYTVSVAWTGPYIFGVRAASPLANQKLHLAVDGADVTGPLILAQTSSWTTYATTSLKGVLLTAGTHFIQVVFDTGSVDLNYLTLSNDGPTPYSGAPIPVPGTIEAEFFDNGGEGSAYHDTTPGNALGQLRATDVDVGTTSDTGGGYSVGWTDPGEWLGYTVSVASSGPYTLGVRAAAPVAGQIVHLEVDGVDVTGPVTVTTSASWTTYATTNRMGVLLTAGTHFMKVVLETGWIDLNYLTLSNDGPTPYSGAPIAVPGTIEAEFFDNGGEGSAYHDTTPGNALGQLRATDVDVGTTSDTGGGYSVGWTDPGEWLGYTVSVASTGTYTLGVRAASPIANQKLHLEVDGVDSTGPVILATTASWTTYATTSQDGIALTAGTHFIQVVFDTGSVDLNYVTLTNQPLAPPPPPPSPPPPPPTTTTPSGTQLYVATNGNDADPGTFAQPWRTIQKAMSSATPGSTVNIRGGTYNERLTLNVSGSAGSYITFQPYGFSVPAGGCGGYTGVSCGGEQVILDYAYLGTVSDGIPFLRISGKSYVRIQGIVFQNFTTYEINYVLNVGARVDGSSSFVELKYDKFLNIKDTAPWNGTSALLPLYVPGPANNVWLYGSEFGNIVSNYGNAVTADGAGQSNFVAENNWLHDTDGIALDLHGGAHDYTIRGNKLEYISKRRDGSIWYGNPSIAIYTDGANTGLVERNFVSDAGVGIQAMSEPGMPSAHDVTIRDNVVQRSGTGIVIGTWYSNTDGSSVYNLNVLNNTFYANTQGIVIRPMVSSTVSWHNNIFAGNGTNYLNTLGWAPGSADYNLYSGGGGGPDAHPVMGNPKFANAAAGDFSLQASSPAIDAGDPLTSISVAGSLDFRGLPRLVNGRIDIGAEEAQ